MKKITLTHQGSQKQWNVITFACRFVLAIFMGFAQTGCSSKSSPKPFNHALKGEYIFRHQGESLIAIEPMMPQQRMFYPWEDSHHSIYPKITKEFFRCKGSSLNPVRLVEKNKESIRYYDCGGAQKHSLPLRDQKEFIYPILIDLLNYIQMKTNKRVVITCGHCCPSHNSYLDSSTTNQTSKHLLGAEVDFYVQGMEHQPEKIVTLLLAFYQEHPDYKPSKDYTEFKRYEKKDTNVSTAPWYNKEIFIKLFKKTEGRDFDNQHHYPYISVQVRYDRDLDEQVAYSWDKAFRNFHRW